MRTLTRWLGFGLLLAVVGCSADPATSPEQASTTTTDQSTVATAHQLRVMMRNIYVGADVDAVITALTSPDPNDDVPALAQAVATLQETDFSVRAEGLAAEVARTRPDVVGLVEVSRIDIDLDLTPLGGPHLVAHEDFLPEILAALRRHDLRYRVGASNLNLTVEPLPGVRLMDYDVTLLGPDAKLFEEPEARNFDNNLGPIAPGVALTYGYTIVPVEVAGQRYRVATTHLQDDVGPLDLSLLRAAQMQELLARLPGGRPSVLLGDLNDPAGAPMYLLALDAGFRDVWTAIGPDGPGYTCCHSTQLTDSRIPNQRIDYVLARGFELGPHAEPGFVGLVGLLPAELLPGPLHPIYVSDHAGVVAGLKFVGR